MSAFNSTAYFKRFSTLRKISRFAKGKGITYIKMFSGLFFFIFELKKLNSRVRKESLKILADRNYLTISGAAGLHLYNIARKSSYGIFDSYFLHCQVNLNWTFSHTPQNNIDETILAHLLKYYIFSSIFFYLS